MGGYTKRFLIMNKKTFDIEGTDLLNERTIDYTSSPFKLKENFKIHCIVVEDHRTNQLIAFYDGPTYILDGRKYEETKGDYNFVLSDYDPIDYEHKQLSEFKSWVESEEDLEIVGHNIIDFDLLACKLFLKLDYSYKHKTWGSNHNTTFEDTLVISKCLNPDRFGGHSLEALGEKVGLSKIKFRKNIPEEFRFLHFAADMLYYCMRDVKVNTKVYRYLVNEMGDWDWSDALDLEHRIRDLVSRASHRGFKYDRNLAQKCVEELTQFMKERADRVDPYIPKKPATKKIQGDFTPPKKQFNKDGELSKKFREFLEELKAEINEETKTIKVFNKEYTLPLPIEPLVTEVTASIEDSTHIKNWLVSLGWDPEEWKEKDLTVKPIKGVGKVKKTKEEYEKCVETYVKQTLESNFCDSRCEFLNTTPEKLKAFLLKKDIAKPVRVQTNPNFTVGQQKDMSPSLERIYDTFPYTKDIVEYLTYRHRRNSILGGGLDWDDEEEAEKGFMAYLREAGRVPTPADTCGASSSRFKHRIVANIPRPSSLYGEPMRAQFGVDDGYIQTGYDFSSLEARIESHYCTRYDKTGDYCTSLLQEKPNDVHTITAKKIADMIERPFIRDHAKAVKYALTYGAAPPKVGKTIGVSVELGKIVSDAFWDAAEPLKRLKSNVEAFWEGKGGKKWVPSVDNRKLPTRAKHALLNTIFQSGGVICAKRAAVIQEDLLEEMGLTVDFFKDDYKNKEYVSPIILYHDECQLEETKSLVKFKTIPLPEGIDDEGKKKLKKQLAELAKQLKEKGEIWSSVGESNGKLYIGRSVAGETAYKAVDMAWRYYKLNVPLGMEYSVGKTWADCH
jgi:hypothetical protein